MFILFKVNNPSGHQALIDVVGRERVLLGFPGAGEERDGETTDSLKNKPSKTQLPGAVLVAQISKRKGEYSKWTF
jgi:hypothetical protein